jgi:hypothetical protein
MPVGVFFPRSQPPTTFKMAPQSRRNGVCVHLSPYITKDLFPANTQFAKPSPKVRSKLSKLPKLITDDSLPKLVKSNSKTPLEKAEFWTDQCYSIDWFTIPLSILKWKRWLRLRTVDPHLPDMLQASFLDDELAYPAFLRFIREALDGGSGSRSAFSSILRRLDEFSFLFIF